ncbi:uncharacterized protein LOC143879391 isoform X2 [Tasmannia lanceolata]|uniref:uncharacterized protein LOC143879391 isoform X2 n=1 Tax=Tasmannia lanceolata TaxID=3420 RepID=UPI004063908C
MASGLSESASKTPRQRSSFLGCTNGSIFMYIHKNARHKAYGAAGDGYFTPHPTIYIRHCLEGPHISSQSQSLAFLTDISCRMLGSLPIFLRNPGLSSKETRPALVPKLRGRLVA